MVALILAWLMAMLTPTRLDLDHVFIVVAPGGSAEIAALSASGLTVSSRVNRHDGQGTASVAAFFGNAYLELIWVDSSVSVDADHRQTYAAFQTASAWRTNGASPFGIGLRRAPDDTADLGVPVTREPASWLPPGQAYELLRQATEPRAHDLFVVPPAAAVPVWVAGRRERAPQLFQHAEPANELTAIRVHGPREQHASALFALHPARVETVTDTMPLLEVVLDGGRQARRIDLRPTLPLILVR